MAQQHERQIEQVERAADAEGDVEPLEAREQDLQAIERGSRPGDRAQHHGEGREESGTAARDRRGLDDQHSGWAGARHGKQMDDREPGEGRDVLHA